MPFISTTPYSSVRIITQLVRSMLNDIGNSGYPVPISSANRTANVVTVTTPTPHGLVTGDTTIIAGMTGGTNLWNGTFMVTYVDTYTFTYNQIGATEAATADTGTSSGTYDGNGTGLGVVYTDPVLVPFINSAYRKAMRALAMTGTTTFREDNVFFNVPAVASPDPTVQVFITDATAPPNQLPPDLIVPLKIWERPANSGTNSDFFLMTDKTNDGGLFPREQVETLLEWEWRKDGIYFVGATQDTQIRLRYQAVFEPVSDGTSTLLIRNCQEMIANYVCGQVCNAKGSPLAAGYVAQFDDSLEDMVAAATRQQQDRGRRRLPFSSRNGRSSGWFF